MNTPEERFDRYLMELRANPESLRAADQCQDALREMSRSPRYGLGEFQQQLEHRIRMLAAQTGRSYESLIMDLHRPDIG